MRNWDEESGGLDLGPGIGGSSIEVKVRDVKSMIEADGWRITAQRGSHRQYVHPTKRGRVTVAGHPNEDMHPKTLADVCRQAQIQKPKS